MQRAAFSVWPALNAALLARCALGIPQRLPHPPPLQCFLRCWVTPPLPSGENSAWSHAPAQFHLLENVVNWKLGQESYFM